MTDSVPITHDENIEVRTISVPDICGFQDRKSLELLVGKAPVQEDSDNYNMEHPNRGTCLVFNHANYDCQINPRMGTYVDVKHIQQTFGQLGFSVDVCNDFKIEDIKKKIKKLSKQDHTDNDCVCVIALTHGAENNLIYARDGKYPLNYLWEPFTADNCITLAKKPKLFFISACRGLKRDNGVSVQFKHISSRTETDGLASSSYVIPAEADFLFGFSTPPGYCSWRSYHEGTWYIQSLCDILDKYAATSDLLDILTKTAQEVAKRSSYDEQDEKMHNKKQIPEFHSRLLHRIYFTQKQGNSQYCNLKQQIAVSDQANCKPESTVTELMNFKPETAKSRRSNSKPKTVTSNESKFPYCAIM